MQARSRREYMVGQIGLVGTFLLFLHLLYTPDAQMFPIVYAIAYALGELTKQRFLTATGYMESGLSTAQIVMFSRILTGLYAAVVVLALL